MLVIHIYIYLCKYRCDLGETMLKKKNLLSGIKILIFAVISIGHVEILCMSVKLGVSCPYTLVKMGVKEKRENRNLPFGIEVGIIGKHGKNSRNFGKITGILVGIFNK